MSDAYESYIPSPEQLRSETLAMRNKEAFDQYVTMRIRGYSSIHAMRVTWGDEYLTQNLGHARAFALDANPYVMREFAKRLDSISFTKLWNPKEAIWMLLQIARDPFAKDQARLNAISELNVLSGITMVDGSGNTKATRGLADFYKDNTTEPPAGMYEEPTDTSAPIKH